MSRRKKQEDIQEDMLDGKSKTDIGEDKVDETKNPKGDTLPPDSVDTNNTTTEETKNDNEEGVIEPVAFDVKLKSHHPQSTYGRCGYRFNKNEYVQIPRNDLTGEQIIKLAEDSWLEFVPVVEDYKES